MFHIETKEASIGELQKYPKVTGKEFLLCFKDYIQLIFMRMIAPLTLCLGEDIIKLHKSSRSGSYE
jgi:hypothetical protein